MKTLKVNEFFWSLQGEGRRAGMPSMFVRLSGCDQTCGFCDTEFESGRAMTLPELAKTLYKALPENYQAEVASNDEDPKTLPGETHTWIVWTGGEPCLQLDAETVKYFHDLGYMQAIETNGAHKPPPGLDWVCCSPKVAEHVLEKNFPDGVGELRYVRHAGQLAVPQPRVEAEYLYLSPMFDGDKPNPTNLKHCIKLCLENPGWQLSVQSHKLLKVL